MARTDSRPVFARLSVDGETRLLDLQQLKKLIDDGEIAACSTDAECQEDAAQSLLAESPHPLKGDRIPRSGKRTVLNQGQTPYCGTYSCAMVLDTLGRPVDISALLAEVPVDAGITLERAASLLRSRGVWATYLDKRSVSDLARYVAGGRPVIVRIRDAAAKFSHAVVVDGVTTRMGVRVVAIRDPQNLQYFSPVSTFEKYFSGEVIVPWKANWK